jgi:hypothetical protein
MEKKYMRYYPKTNGETNLQEIINLIRADKSNDYPMVYLFDGDHSYVIIDTVDFAHFIAELQGFELDRTEDY